MYIKFDKENIISLIVKHIINLSAKFLLIPILKYTTIIKRDPNKDNEHVEILSILIV